MNGFKLLVSLISFLLISPVSAATAPQTTVDKGSIVDAATMPRARVWRENQLWQTTAGVILTCNEQYDVSAKFGVDRPCISKDNKTRWAPLATKQEDGFVLKGYEFRFYGSSGSMILIAYYGPP